MPNLKIEIIDETKQDVSGTDCLVIKFQVAAEQVSIAVPFFMVETMNIEDIYIFAFKEAADELRLG